MIQPLVERGLRFQKPVLDRVMLVGRRREEGIPTRRDPTAPTGVAGGRSGAPLRVLVLPAVKEERRHNPECRSTGARSRDARRQDAGRGL